MSISYKKGMEWTGKIPRERIKHNFRAKTGMLDAKTTTPMIAHILNTDSTETMTTCTNILYQHAEESAEYAKFHTEGISEEKP